MQFISRSRLTAPRLQGTHCRQSEAQKPERPGMEEVAPGQSVTEVDRFPSIDPQHGESLAREGSSS